MTQVYRDPVPAASLVCHDLTDGAGAASEAGAARPGSFHRAFTSQNTNKNAFRVSHGECFDAENNDRAITLMAADEHSKKQWVSAIQKTVTKAQSNVSQADGSPKLSENKSTPRTSPRRLNKAQKKLSGQLLNLSARASSPKLISASKLLSTPKVKSSSKLASASKVLSPTTRGMFKKNQKSPLIKSSLSQSTMEKIQSGGVKKIRSKARLNDENIFRGAIVLDGGASAALSSRRSKSAAKVTNVKRSRRMLQLIDENTK